MPKLLRAGAFIIALTLPALAWAQGSILQGGLAPPGHVPMYSGPSSAATIVGDSGSANGTCSGGPVNCGLSEFLQEDRFPGLGPFGTNSCFYDLGETHYLCFDANASGRGLIAFGAVGNAAPIPLTCIINGVTQNCLGTANIVPPVTLTDVQTNPIAIDGASLTVQTQSGTTAQQIANWVFFAPGTMPLWTDFDAVRGVTVTPAGSTTLLINGVAAYLDNLAVSTPNFPASVGLFAAAISDVDGAKTWGINTVCTDNRGQVLSTHGSRFCLNEFDFNITSANTQITGLQFAGTAYATPALANALVFFPFGGTGAKWTNALVSTDGAAQIGINIGASATAGSSLPGQINQFWYRDAGGNRQNETLTANGATLTIGGSAGWGLFIADGNGLATSAITIGKTLTSGANLASQFELFNWTDGTSTQQNYAIRADTNGQLAVTSSAASPIFAVNGVIKAVTSFNLGTNVGVTCSGTPTASFASIGGIVTHC